MKRSNTPAVFGRLSAALVAAIALLALSAIGPADRTEAATFTVNSTNDVDDTVCNGTHCSLREAINAANAAGGHDIIEFSISGGGVKTITPTSALPTVTGSVTIDGWTQPGFSGTPLIELNGTSAGAGSSGFEVSVSYVSIYGFVINRFGMDGIRVNSGGLLILTGSYVGTNAAGTAAGPGNGDHGVQFLTGSSGTLGSSVTYGRNVISGNVEDGVQVDSGVGLVQIHAANIGTNAAGSAAVPNGDDGIEATDAVTIGQPAFAFRNVISGNTDDGIRLGSASNVGSIVQNSRIGTDITGVSSLGNGGSGIVIEGGATNADIGLDGVVNTIAYNGGAGIEINTGATTGNTFQGNSIHSNTGPGIEISASMAQGSILAPTITASPPYPPHGTACGGCTVDIYSDTVDEGRIHHGSVVASGGGAWTFYGRVDGPNITATATDGSGNTSEFSSALAKTACGSPTCVEGLWHVDYSGMAGVTYNCTAWVNQAGATTQWGHLSCTNGLTPDFTGTLDQGTNVSTVYGVYPAGATFTATGTFTEDGNSASGTWTCTLGCADSGSWVGSRHAASVTIAAGGGTSPLASSPPASISVPISPNSPAVTVDAGPLTTIPVGAFPVRTAYDFEPSGHIWSTDVTMTVTYVLATDLPQAPYSNCTYLAMYVRDEQTGVWTYDGPVECNGTTTFKVALDHFSVRGFFAGLDAESSSQGGFCSGGTGDCVIDGIDDCPTTADGDAESTDIRVTLPGDLSITYWDRTWPNGDNKYNPLFNCETDAYSNPSSDSDNDGRTNTQEASASGCGAFAPTNPLKRDSDGDNYLDGAECVIGTNPNSLSNKPTIPQCVAAAGAPATGNDADGDLLKDWAEFCLYGTNKNDDNTDDDFKPLSDGPPPTLGAAMKDGCEVADNNAGIGTSPSGATFATVNVIDLQQVAKRGGGYTLPGAPWQVAFDFDKSGAINVIDLQQMAPLSSPGVCP